MAKPEFILSRSLLAILAIVVTLLVLPARLARRAAPRAPSRAERQAPRARAIQPPGEADSFTAPTPTTQTLKSATPAPTGESRGYPPAR